MCYHASVAATFEQLSDHYDKPFEGDFAIFFAKTEVVGYHLNGFNFPVLPVITQQEPSHISLAQWGLIPRWIKSEVEANQIRLNTLNAKIETLLEKPSFKQAALSQRCLVPMTGFFEWQQLSAKEKQPYFIHLKDQAIFSVAGITETWIKPGTTEVWQTLSLITTEANALMANIHNTKKRMPLMINQEAEQLWLNRDLEAEEIIQEIKPLEVERMEAYKIGKLIGRKNANTNTPEVLKPFIEPQTNLFGDW